MTFLRFQCPHCGKTLKATSAEAGRQVRCTGCGQQITAPRWQGQEEVEPDDEARARLGDEQSLDPFQVMSARRTHPEDLIDMTAMVDIVFFLLIFFLVTSMQALVAVMDMPPAHASQAAAGKARTVAEMQADPEFLVLKIEEDDTFWIEDEQIFNDQDLGVKLRNEREKDSERRSILVLGSADASQGAAVAAFDACMDAGFDDIRLSIQEQTDEVAP